MKIVKYSKEISTDNAKSSNGGGSSSTNIFMREDNSSLDRTIWGQQDNGEDIDGHMEVNGDITIKSVQYDEDEEYDGDEEREEGGGNLIVELSTTTKDLNVTEDAHIGRHLFIHYPEHTDDEKCIRDILSTTNGRIDVHCELIAKNTEKIEENAEKITELEEAAKGVTPADNIEEMLYQLLEMGSPTRPIVLYSGQLYRVNGNATNYFDKGCSNPYLQFGTIRCQDGLMTIPINALSDKTIHISSVHVTQYSSGDTGDDITNTRIEGRSDGAHWFECRTDSENNTKNVYVREFHQANGNNDSWLSDSWFGGGGQNTVYITIIGYVTEAWVESGYLYTR